ncbi:MAG: OmpA family protein [Haliscomenobacter sp.]|uniref:OmpA family protein n=1 Tax=Haliscomenobacter sp. TaxID=2717303 RepID=UPI0029BBA32C|nr:OmpA family protein [Haliscomenobacter sp.]MDX2067111.1 OmpA family protein [Haliscomenobacter sp.]
MRNLLPILVFFALAVLACWWFVCLILGQNGPTMEVNNTNERPKTLAFNHGTQTILKAYDHFAFDTGQVSPKLNANNALFLDKITAYLQENPDLLLNITGGYGIDEEGLNRGFFENLGLARANAVRDLLIERKLDPDRITLSFNTGAGAIRQQPITFNAYTPAQSVDFVPLAYTFEDMTFSDESFVPNGSEFRPILPLVEYADSVRKFLALHKERGLSIIGHTDNQGDAKANLALGTKRAENVMRYFRELGVPPRQMAAFSEGGKHPVSANNTEVGQRRNRRINFIIE